MGRKKIPKIYLDTSVLGVLVGPEKADRKEATQRLWNRCKSNKYKVFMSRTVFDEIERAPEPIRTQIWQALESITYKRLEESEQVNDLANEYIAQGLLTDKQFDDCMHIAYAAFYKCDALVTWNIKHLARNKTNEGVRTVNLKNGIGMIKIMIPSILLNMENLKWP